MKLPSQQIKLGNITTQNIEKQIIVWKKPIPVLTVNQEQIQTISARGANREVVF
jgi:hypothetical protein